MLTTRRLFLIGLTASLGSTAMLSPAVSAAAEDGPDAFIRLLGSQAIRMLSDPALSPQQREAELRRLLVAGFDLELISRFVLGRFWRQASESQRAEYRQLFEDFIVKSYAARLGEYSGEHFDVRDVRPTEGGEMLVMTHILRPSGPPVRVDWRLRRQPQQFKIVDVSVEGISMAITQRQEFTAVIQSAGGNVETLLDRLRQKVSERR